MRAASKKSIGISFVYRGIRCKERIGIAPTPANLRRAEQFRASVLEAIARGTFEYGVTFPDSPRRFLFSDRPAAAGMMLETYLETWLARQGERLKSSTVRGYQHIVYNSLIPAFRGVPLADLRRPAIREMLDRIPATNKRLANVQSVLRAALQDAVGDDLIDANPLYGWTYAPRARTASEREIDPLSADEQAAVLAACREPQHRNLIQFALWTGLRTSELIALHWGDVDWLRGVVRVARAKTQAATVAEAPKTRRSAREVKLLSPALAALEAQKPHTFLAGSEIFHNPRTGEPWRGDQPIRKLAWQPALRAAGVRYRYPYQTRHTYASMMLSAGESPLWLAAQMGHTDLNMISRVYGRWMPEAAPEAGKNAEQIFQRNVSLTCP